MGKQMAWFIYPLLGAVSEPEDPAAESHTLLTCVSAGVISPAGWRWGGTEVCCLLVRPDLPVTLGMGQGRSWDTYEQPKW